MMSDLNVRAWSAIDEVRELLRDDPKAYGVECHRRANAFGIAGGWEAFPFSVTAFGSPDDRGFVWLLTRAFQTEAAAKSARDRVADLARAAGIRSVRIAEHAANGDELRHELNRF